tara:strand:- start:897 stop:1166 length:270 start_codon:yes stop_codon:yes gene_type:complete
MRKKYADKPPVARFFHKYTGFIVMGSILAIAGMSYLWYDSTLEFYDRFTCSDVKIFSEKKDLMEELNPKQISDINQIITECQGNFLPKQ